MEASEATIVEKIASLMKERGFRATPQRVMIAKLIVENVASHPSLKELHEMASKVLPGVGVSTVYNTIVMLESMNLIKTFYVEGRLHVDKFETHLNIYCKDEGRILDLEGEAGEEIVGVLRKHGVIIENPVILVTGKCKPSSASESSPSVEFYEEG
ncbi:MAG: transcriptional repressor [Acidilobaceae archaeon]